jgi:hypothetical protein
MDAQISKMIPNTGIRINHPGKVVFDIISFLNTKIKIAQLSMISPEDLFNKDLSASK